MEEFTPVVSVIIPTPTTKDPLTLQCINSLTLKGKKIEIIPEVWDISYAKTCNKGIKRAKADIVAITNNDTLAPPQWLRLLEHFKDDNVGMVCGKEANTPQYVPHGKVILGGKDFFGGFFLMRKAYFDEQFEPYYFEDADMIATALYEGVTIIQDQRVQIMHLKSYTINEDKDRKKHFVKNREKFIKKWGYDCIPS